MPVFRILAAAALSGTLVALAWWLPNRPQNPYPDLPPGRFNSLSYAGYRPGQSPFAGRFATSAQVDQDMALLAPLTRAIRSYSALEGDVDLPALARKHGLKLWQGIWLGANRAQNAKEMEAAIRLANRNPDVIERIVVGNEVLLRRDLPVAELTADIDHVRAAVKQPVAYADVADFWDQFPQVAPHVDVVLVHLLPYWEDVPTGIDHAVQTVGAVYTHFQNLFPGKTIAIGETGWPSRGRERRDAVPSRLNEARFLRGFLALAQARHLDYNFIEAFDQQWKYESEGIVGANWGLLTADRQVKIPLAGPLSEDPLWPRHAGFSLLCGAALAALGCAGRPARPALAAALGMALGAALGFAAADALPVLYDPHVVLAAGVNLGGQAMLAALMMARVAGLIAACPQRTGADATTRVQNLLRLRWPGGPGLLEDTAFIFVWTAAVEQILLVCDPRYRAFPASSFAVPMVVLAARAAHGDFRATRGGKEEWLVGLALNSGAIASLVQEGPHNGQSILWNICAVLLAWSVSWGGIRKQKFFASFFQKRRKSVLF